MEHKKKIVRVLSTAISPYTFEKTLSSLRDEINELIKENGKDAKVEWNPHYYYPYEHEPSPRFEIYIQREETDEEFEKRVAQETEKANEKEKREREEFERLRAKFGEN